MKTSLIVGMALAALVAGCGDDPGTKTANSSQQTNSSASDGNVLTAPVDYLGAIAKAKQVAVKTVDLASVNQAIHMFQVEQGRNPKDLNELVQEKYLIKVPAAPYGTRLVYDPATGQARVVKQ